MKMGRKQPQTALIVGQSYEIARKKKQKKGSVMKFIEQTVVYNILKMYIYVQIGKLYNFHLKHALVSFRGGLILQRAKSQRSDSDCGAYESNAIFRKSRKDLFRV